MSALAAQSRKGTLAPVPFAVALPVAWQRACLMALIFALSFPSVSGLSRSPKMISAGVEHTCTLLEDDVLKCWGYNGEGRTQNMGQLMQGDKLNRGDAPNEMGDFLLPVNLGTGRYAKKVSAGKAHTCALLDDNTIKCCGWSWYGETGQGNKYDRCFVPEHIGNNLPTVPLGTGRYPTTLDTGWAHSCVILDDGSLKCWGHNLEGQLGQGTTNSLGDNYGEMGDSLPPVDLGQGRSAKHTALGYLYTCALLDNHQVKCWGSNAKGQLGLGDMNKRGDNAGEMGNNLPFVDLGTGRSAKTLAAGYQHTCAILDDGSLKCWGQNDWGNLGLGDNIHRGDEPGEMGDNLPAVDLGTGRYAKDIVVSDSFTCALLDDGSMKCFGRNERGELGRGSTNSTWDDGGKMGDSLPAVDLGTGRTVKNMSAYGRHVCVVLDDQSTKCWGNNEHGNLGLGDSEHRGDEPGEMGDNLPAVFLACADPCGAGTYASPPCSASSSTKCTPCPVACNAGSYETKSCTTTSNPVCSPCAPGSYSAAGATSCTSCSAEYYSLATGASSSSTCTRCATCGAGFYASTECTPNTNRACSPCAVTCAAGTFESTKCTSSTNPVCTECPAGQYSSAGSSSCTLCGAGTFSSATRATSSSTCNACGAGNFSPEGSSSCTGCTAGSYSSGVSECLPCSSGSYSAAGASSCTNCSTGFYSTAVGATSSSSCEECAQCDAGTFEKSPCSADKNRVCAQCSLCSFGTYETTECTPTTDRVCSPCAVSCPEGQFEEAPCTSSEPPVCSPCAAECAAGAFESQACASSANRECSTCGTGGYSASAGATSCSSCAAGNYSAATGATSSSTCHQCPKGSYSATDASSCTLCEAGTFAEASGASICLQCTAGSFAPSGATSCTSCSAGTYSTSSGSSICLQCEAESFAPAGASSCSVCSPACVAGVTYESRSCGMGFDRQCTPGATPPPTPAPTPPPVAASNSPLVLDVAQTVSGQQKLPVSGSTNLTVIVGSGAVTVTVLSPSAGEELKVQLAGSNGASVDIPVSAMVANQQVQLAAVSSSVIIAASPLPPRTTALSEGMALALVPPVQVEVAFMVSGLVRRQQNTVYRVHWLDKISNEWRALCSEHWRNTKTEKISAPLTTEVQSDLGFNPSMGCAAAVSPCDGSGGTLLVLGLDAEPAECSAPEEAESSDLSVGFLAGIVVGAVAFAALLGGVLFVLRRRSKKASDKQGGFSNIAGVQQQGSSGGAGVVNLQALEPTEERPYPGYAQAHPGALEINQSVAHSHEGAPWLREIQVQDADERAQHDAFAYQEAVAPAKKNTGQTAAIQASLMPVSGNFSAAALGSLSSNDTQAKPAGAGQFAPIEQRNSTIPKVEYQALAVEREIGSGSFKRVFKATWSRQGLGPCNVAVLVLRQGGDVSAELAVFEKVGRHHNLTRLLATTVDFEGRVCLVTEYASWGSLDSVVWEFAEKETNISDAVLLTVATQVCEGMRVLRLHGMVHRDLAARNILVFEFNPTLRRSVSVKISDYGLTLKGGYGTAYVQQGLTSSSSAGKGPVRWSSPEVITHGRFGEKSDVWAFGVLLWEIWSECRIPFCLQPDDGKVAELVCEERRVLERPPQCSDDVHALMARCWAYAAKDRPTFDQLRQELDDCLSALLAGGGGGGNGRGGADQENLCVVCIEHLATHVVVPCGHEALCQGCSELVEGSGVCPVCRGEASAFMRIFKAGLQE